MNDSDLLAKAAQAAGDEVFGEPGLWFRRLPHSMVTGWNPLTDDGDALRLAVKLGIYITTNSALVSVSGPKGGYVELNDSDPCAALRKLITRAAAAMAPSEGREG